MSTTGMFLIVTAAAVAFALFARRKPTPAAAPEPRPSVPEGVTMPEPFTAWVGIERVEVSPGISRWNLTLRAGAPADIETAFEYASMMNEQLGGIGGFGPQQLINLLVTNRPKP